MIGSPPPRSPARWVGHRRPGRDRPAAADDGVGAEMTGREIADVHPAATSAAVALFLAEELGDRPVDVLAEGRAEELVASRANRRAGQPRPGLGRGGSPAGPE